MNECQTCHGTYEPVLPDGTLYFHRCPPLSVRELRDAHDAGRLQLTLRDQVDYDRAAKLDAASPAAVDEPSRVEQFYSTLVVERPNVRDENVVATGDKKNPVALKAEGGGALELVEIGDGPTRLVSSV